MGNQWFKEEMNISGLVTNAIFFLFLVIIFWQPILLRLKQLFMHLKRSGNNKKNKIHIQNRTPKLKLKKVVERLQNPKRLERIQLRQQEVQISFICGMLYRGYTPIHNAGDGNCVFISLAQIVVRDTAKFQFMRQMIVRRLRNFQTKYDEGQVNHFKDYCDIMDMNGRAASMLELQAIADICFSVVECYSAPDCFMPMHIIYPLRY